jgi:hypothetical protein
MPHSERSDSITQRTVFGTSSMVHMSSLKYGGFVFTMFITMSSSVLCSSNSSISQTIYTKIDCQLPRNLAESCSHTSFSRYR